jgi:hypothetical protein
MTKNSIAVFAGAVMGIALSANAFAGTYSSQNMAAQFESPSDWTISESNDIAPYISLLPGPEEARSRQGVGMSITIEVPFDGPIPTDLSQVRGYFDGYMTEGGRPYTVVSEEDTSVAGYPAKQITFLNEYQSMPGQPARHKEIFFFSPNGELFMISYSGLDTVFEQYWQEARVVIDTFRFTA